MESTTFPITLLTSFLRNTAKAVLSLRHYLRGLPLFPTRTLSITLPALVSAGVVFVSLMREAGGTAGRWGWQDVPMWPDPSQWVQRPLCS